MSKINLRKIALKGLTTGLIVHTHLAIAASAASPSQENLLKEMENAKGGNFGYHLYSEEELQMELTPDGLRMYNALTPEGKRLARVVASSRCDGQNECKGLNSCKGEKNDCAGKGSCKGTSKCATATKDLAVKLVTDRMASKRASAINLPNPPTTTLKPQNKAAP